jgi:hypothetical protein
LPENEFRKCDADFVTGDDNVTDFCYTAADNLTNYVDAVDSHCGKVLGYAG